MEQLAGILVNSVTGERASLSALAVLRCRFKARVPSLRLTVKMFTAGVNPA